MQSKFHAKAESLTQDAIRDFERSYWRQYTTEKFAKWVALAQSLHDALYLIHLQDLNIEASDKAQEIVEDEEDLQGRSDNTDDYDSEVEEVEEVEEEEEDEDEDEEE
jgi:uncharacterized protein (DUF3084 family)